MKKIVLVFLLIGTALYIRPMNKVMQMKSSTKRYKQPTSAIPLNMVLVFDRTPVIEEEKSVVNHSLNILADFFASALLAKNCAIWVDAVVWNKFVEWKIEYTNNKKDLETLPPLIKGTLNGLEYLIDNLLTVDEKIKNAQKNNNQEDLETYELSKKKSIAAFQEINKTIAEGMDSTLYALRVITYHHMKFNPSEWDIYQMDDLGYLFIPSIYKEALKYPVLLPGIHTST